eukprot:125464_1
MHATINDVKEERDTFNSIETPPEIIKYENEYDESDKKLETYLSTKYSKEISSFKFFPNDILIRYVMGYKHIENDYNFKKRKEDSEYLFSKYLKWHKNSEYDIITQKLSLKEIELLAPDIFFYGNDKYGHPIVYNTGIRYRKNGDLSIFKNKKTNEFNAEIIDKYVAFILKKLHELKIKNSKIYKVNCMNENKIGIYQMVVIVDINGFSIPNFFYERKMFEYMTMIVNELTPDSLHKVYIINAPYLFTVVWNILKNFIHPITVEKVSILGSNYINTIKKEINVNMIPKEYGGKGKWKIKYGDVPEGFY